MSEETQPPITDGKWNSETIYKTFDQRLTSMTERINRRFEEMDEAMTSGLEGQWSRTQDSFEASAMATTTAMAAAEKAVNAALVASEKAVLKAEALAQHNTAQQNEWRGTVNDLISTMMPRAEWQLAHATLLTDMDKQAELIALNMPRREYQGQHDALVSQMQALTDRMNTSQGASMGASKSMVWLIAIIGALVGVSGFMFALIEFLKG
jgi:hypothetical protein